LQRLFQKGILPLWVQMQFLAQGGSNDRGQFTQAWKINKFKLL
jgi:hypothetical protein